MHGTSTLTAIGPLLLALTLSTSQAQATARPASQLPVIQITGAFGKTNGHPVVQAQLSGSILTPTTHEMTRPSDPLWRSSDADRLLLRDTSNQFILPALTATAGLTAVVSTEIFRAIREHRSLDLNRLYRNSILATASGFAVGTLGAPGITNHLMARGVVDAALRYISKVLFMGESGRENAGSFSTDILMGALRGAVESMVPAEVLTWLPCQQQDLPSDICNGLYALAGKSLLQGSEEIASQLLARGLTPDSPRLSKNLMSSFFRGAAFGAVEQTLWEITFGAPQWMSPTDRARMSELFNQLGLSEGTQECFEKSTFLYGGLWSHFTRNEDISFNIGTTTMIDREFYFLDQLDSRTAGLLTHEVGGHCTQWLNLGLVEFLGQYLAEFSARGTPPAHQGELTFERNTLGCSGNSFECEAAGIQFTVIDLISTANSK
jgi:hypothetical protein